MQRGGGGGSQSLYGLSTSTAEIAPPAIASSDTHLMQQPVEAASPISSRPPAAASLDELMGLAASAGADEDAPEGGGGGGGGGGSGGGNRWPRQETLALIKIRTEMDSAFRDATVKGPLWEDVSRKLAELGYRRSDKKCKEKFENVHKYYKRTKEGRAGRQDGKNYKFFEQLEALHKTTASTSTHVSASQAIPATATTATAEASASLDVSPVSIGIPMPTSSVRITQPPPTTSSVRMSLNVFPHNLSAAAMPLPPTSLIGSAAPAVTTGGANIGISFSSSSSSSSSQGTEDDYDEDDDETEGQPLSNPAGSSRKRKRRSGGSSARRMMEFFENLTKQVMQKQEAMQKRFLEVIEKREQDRMIREEAWKRQETARLSREHELMAQERAISASRDAAIVSFLQKLTGQTIQLPQPVTIPAFTPPPPPPQPVPSIHVTPSMPPRPPPSVPQQPQQQSNQPQQIQQQQQHSQSVSSEAVMAIPEQQIPPQDVSASGSYEPISSRWLKAEILTLINLRSGLESRYQEAGPKGPLWEEISAGMTRLGYQRNSKRCKEKWENINKYFKKVKENNKQRPEDSKTCPYYHELDALYRRKVLSSTSGGGGTSTGGTAEQWQQQESTNMEPSPATLPSDVPVLTGAAQAEQASQASNVGLPSSLFEEGNGGGATKEKTL
ncbi:trihelix transcription factor GTL1-like isoform X2 [Tripterygium wilfordii]|uniref:trihelix transcription factor GTL1-like isoform X2 n=1 Tax=Tripterygium wilfordii TaxID=458696 RepID=UPI0018F85AF4|nr:trihelix transcription factor GTL1-like isoform X2 [Tripterygium wilfordii]